MEATSGPADPPLSDLGRRQAGTLVRLLSAEPIDAIVSSPLQRAQQTARPLSLALDLPVEVDEQLTEWDHDHSSYIPVHELRESDPPLWQRLMSGELPAEVDAVAFRARVHTALERIIAAHPGRRSVAVICHAGVINAAICRYLGVDRPLPFVIDYCSVSRILGGRDGRRVIVSVNESGHIPAHLRVGRSRRAGLGPGGQGGADGRGCGLVDAEAGEQA